MSVAKTTIPRPSIQDLSNLIFGLALSIGAIQLVGNLPKTHVQLVTALAAFGFSFLILINVWNRYSTIISVVPVETTGVVRLNMLLLFLVSVEPYLFNLLNTQTLSSPFSQEVSTYYALDIAGMNFVLAYFAHILTRKEKGLIPAELINRFKRTRNAIIGVGAIFAFSAIPVFWDVIAFALPLRIIIWMLTVPVILFSRISNPRTNPRT